MKKPLDEIKQDLLDAGFVVYEDHVAKLKPGMYLGLFHGFACTEDHQGAR